MDKEQKAIERIKLASQLSLQKYGKPLICTYSGGKDSEEANPQGFPPSK